MRPQSSAQGTKKRKHRSSSSDQSSESATRVAVYDGELTLQQPQPRRITVNVTLTPATFNALHQEQLRGTDLQLPFVVTARDQTSGHTHTKHATVPLSRQFQLPLTYEFEPGHHYTFTLTVNKSVNDQRIFLFRKSLEYYEVEHKTVFSKLELQQLKKKAEDHVKGKLPVMYAYRNKPEWYFQNILQNRGSIMEVYIKDENGDPLCPINGQINGLFFAVRPNPKTKQLPTESFFGGMRICLPVQDLFKSHLRFYFADFWCHNQKAHHVTLVATKPHSPADVFCNEHLLKISITKNKFFFREQDGHYFCCTVPEVEILYTENVDLKAPNISWHAVKPLGRGSSLPSGIKKNKNCNVCNLP